MDLFRSPFMSVTIHGSSTRYNPRHDCDCSHHSRSHSPDLQNKTKYYGYREHTRLDQPFSTVFCFAADYHATLSFCNFLIFSPFLRSSLHRSNHSSFRSFSTSFPNRSITFISRPSFHYIHFASFPPIILSVFLNPFCLFIILNSLTIFMYSISLLVRLLLSALYEGFFPLASLLYHSYTILNSAHSPRSLMALSNGTMSLLPENLSSFPSLSPSFRETTGTETQERGQENAGLKESHGGVFRVILFHALRNHSYLSRYKQKHTTNPLFCEYSTSERRRVSSINVECTAVEARQGSDEPGSGVVQKGDQIERGRTHQGGTDASVMHADRNDAGTYNEVRSEREQGV